MNISPYAVSTDGVDIMAATAGSFAHVAGWDGDSVGTGTDLATDIMTPYGVTRKGMTITNGEWGRKMGCNGAWSCIRIGALVRLAVSSSIAASPAVLFFGVCSGTAKMYGAADCIRAYGMMLGFTQRSRGTFSYQVGIAPDAAGIARHVADYMMGASKIAGVAAEAQPDGSQIYGKAIVATEGYWSCLFCEIHRPVNDTQATVWAGTTEPKWMDRTFVMKNLIAEAYRANAVNARQADNGMAQIASISRFTPKGTDMDTVNLYWSGPGTLEVGAIMASRQF